MGRRPRDSRPASTIGKLLSPSRSKLRVLHEVPQRENLHPAPYPPAETSPRITSLQPLHPTPGPAFLTHGGRLAKRRAPAALPQVAERPARRQGMERDRRPGAPPQLPAPAPRRQACPVFIRTVRRLSILLFRSLLGQGGPLRSTLRCRRL